VAGVPAPSTPPQYPGSRARFSKQHSNSPDNWKIEKVVAGPVVAVYRIMTTQDPADMLDAVRSLRARLQEIPYGQVAQDEIGSDARLLPLIGRLLTDDSRRLQWTATHNQCYNIDLEVLSLLRDLCSGHADNVRRLCQHDATLTAISTIALNVAAGHAGGSDQSAKAAEILSFCMIDDDNWDKFAAARLRVKSSLVPVKSAVVLRQSSFPHSARVRHSANYDARQAVLGKEYVA